MLGAVRASNAYDSIGNNSRDFIEGDFFDSVRSRRSAERFQRPSVTNLFAPPNDDSRSSTLTDNDLSFYNRPTTAYSDYSNGNSFSSFEQFRMGSREEQLAARSEPIESMEPWPSRDDSSMDEDIMKPLNRIDASESFSNSFDTIQRSPTWNNHRNQISHIEPQKLLKVVPVKKKVQIMEPKAKNTSNPTVLDLADGKADEEHVTSLRQAVVFHSRMYPENQNDLKHLFLSNNGIKDVRQDMLPAPYLETLDLSYNAYRNLPVSVSKNMPCIKTLLMPGNQLSSLPSMSQWCAPKLEHLSLFQNRLTQLPTDFCFNSLMHLDLARNRLTTLPPSIFQLCGALKHLDVSGNMIQSLPEDIGKATNLEKLLVSSNQIKVIPQSMNQLNKLKELDLSENQIMWLDLNAVSGWKSLTRLSLHSNQLKALPDNCNEWVKLEWLDIRNNAQLTLPSSAIHLFSHLFDCYAEDSLIDDSLTKTRDATKNRLGQLFASLLTQHGIKIECIERQTKGNSSDILITAKDQIGQKVPLPVLVCKIPNKPQIMHDVKINVIRTKEGDLIISKDSEINQLTLFFNNAVIYSGSPLKMLFEPKLIQDLFIISASKSYQIFAHFEPDQFRSTPFPETVHIKFVSATLQTKSILLPSSQYDKNSGSVSIKCPQMSDYSIILTVPGATKEYKLDISVMPAPVDSNKCQALLTNSKTLSSKSVMLPGEMIIVHLRDEFDNVIHSADLIARWISSSNFEVALQTESVDNYFKIQLPTSLVGEGFLHLGVQEKQKLIPVAASPYQMILKRVEEKPKAPPTTKLLIPLVDLELDPPQNAKLVHSKHNMKAVGSEKIVTVQKEKQLSSHQLRNDDFPVKHVSKSSGTNSTIDPKKEEENKPIANYQQPNQAPYINETSKLNDKSVNKLDQIEHNQTAIQSSLNAPSSLSTRSLNSHEPYPAMTGRNKTPQKNVTPSRVRHLQVYTKSPSKSPRAIRQKITVTSSYSATTKVPLGNEIVSFSVTKDFKASYNPLHIHDYVQGLFSRPLSHQSMMHAAENFIQYLSNCDSNAQEEVYDSAITTLQNHCNNANSSRDNESRHSNPFQTLLYWYMNTQYIYKNMQTIASMTQRREKVQKLASSFYQLFIKAMQVDVYGNDQNLIRLFATFQSPNSTQAKSTKTNGIFQSLLPLQNSQQPVDNLDSMLQKIIKNYNLLKASGISTIRLEQVMVRLLDTMDRILMFHIQFQTSKQALQNIRDATEYAYEWSENHEMLKILIPKHFSNTDNAIKLATLLPKQFSANQVNAVIKAHAMKLPEQVWKNIIRNQYGLQVMQLVHL